MRSPSIGTKCRRWAAATVAALAFFVAGPVLAGPSDAESHRGDLAGSQWRLPPPGVSLPACLVVSGAVFTAGFLVVVLRRSAVGVLMGLELILNAAALNFVVFASYTAQERTEGYAMALFLIAIAAAEACVALAIVLGMFRNLQTVKVDAARSLKG